MKLCQAQYTVVRFIPDLIKDEPINIGLILQSNTEKYFKSKFSNKKIDRLHRFNSDTNLELVKCIVKELEEIFNNDNWILKNRDCKKFESYSMIQKLNYFHANQIQFTKPKGIITQDLHEEFQRLFQELVYRENVTTTSRGIENRTMKKRFRDEFLKRGLIQNELVSENFEQIGGFGEKLIYDFSYLNGKRNLINNVSFDMRSKEPIETAKNLLSNYYGIKEIAVKKGNSENVDIKVIYYIPDEKMTTDSFDQVLDCLKESSDELINFKDEEHVRYFIEKIEKEAHK